MHSNNSKNGKNVEEECSEGNIGALDFVELEELLNSETMKKVISQREHRYRPSHNFFKPNIEVKSKSSPAQAVSLLYPILYYLTSLYLFCELT
jgi:hypothetical protein